MELMNDEKMPNITFKCTTFDGFEKDAGAKLKAWGMAVAQAQLDQDKKAMEALFAVLESLIKVWKAKYLK